MLKKPIKDAIEIYQYVASESPMGFEILAEEFNDYFRSTPFWQREVDRTRAGVAVERNLFLYLVHRLNDAAERRLTHEQLPDVIPLVYQIRDYAARHRDVGLFSAILDLMNNLLYEMLRRGDRYSKTVATHMLYLQEISFPYLLNIQFDNGTGESLLVFLDQFCKPLVEKAVRAAIEAMYYLVNYSYDKPEQEILTYLRYNAQTLMQFLGDVLHWKDMHEFKQFKVDQAKLFGNELVMFSVFVFRKSYHEGYSPSILREIGLPIADNPVTIGRYFGMESDKFLTELFFDYTLVFKPSFERFDEPDITTAATNTGSVYQLSMFWATLSIYRRLRGETFIPLVEAIPADSEMNGVETLLKRLEYLDVRKVALMLQREDAEIAGLVREYRTHIETILGGRGRRITR